MKSTGQQLLRSPDIKPTGDIIAKALGEANNTYVKFINGLTDHGIQLEWRYYTDGKAWLAKGLHKWTGVRGGQNEETVFWLSVWDGYFKVTIYVPGKARADMLNLPLEDEVKQMIAESKQMGARLKYFPITFEMHSEEMLETVYTLSDFRKNIK